MINAMLVLVHCCPIDSNQFFLAGQTDILFNHGFGFWIEDRVTREIIQEEETDVSDGTHPSEWPC